jgi:hypothetical protein
MEYSYVDRKNEKYTYDTLYRVGDKIKMLYKLPRKIPIGIKLLGYHGGDCVTTHDINYKMKIRFL